MRSFVHRGQITKVVFGTGTRKGIADEVRALGCDRALVVCTPGQTQQAGEVSELLGPLGVATFDQATAHTPIAVTNKAVDFARAVGADCVVAVGGGSPIGLGKAMTSRTGLPHLALPTTYAGSEMTPILGETHEGTKTTRRLPQVLLKTVVYDVDLTLTLPPDVAAVSGLNAMAHAVEALYAQGQDPLAFLMAGEALDALAAALPAIVRDPADQEARGTALYGAWLAGTCLGTVGMALHHKVCHVLGGTFDLPHAKTHAVVLPHVIAYNAPAASPAMARIGKALPGPGPARAIFEFAGRIGAPSALRDLGMPASGIREAADLIVRDGYWNPRPVDQDAVRVLLERAWAGEPPLSASVDPSDPTGAPRA
ncbi:maleylacetate reductase [Streptomyces sp. NPDC002205]|uniref:maleylacetate reductase n=1 Tax=Streptomyces sp. NPDC002205 TaxID=3154411 RepID=UPI003322FCFB